MGNFQCRVPGTASIQGYKKSLFLVRYPERAIVDPLIRHGKKKTPGAPGEQGRPFPEGETHDPQREFAHGHCALLHALVPGAPQGRPGHSAQPGSAGPRHGTRSLAGKRAGHCLLFQGLPPPSAASRAPRREMARLLPLHHHALRQGCGARGSGREGKHGHAPGAFPDYRKGARRLALRSRARERSLSRAAPHEGLYGHGRDPRPLHQPLRLQLRGSLRESAQGYA